MMRPQALMLFAAGFGTRMGRLTDRRPKPLLEVSGRPLIEHALEQAEGQNLTRIVVNAHYHSDQIVTWAEKSGVSVSHESPDILDTGGGLRAAVSLLGEGPVFTLNTDAVWDGPPALQFLLEAWAPERMDGLLLLAPLDRVLGRHGPGDFNMDPLHRLERGGHLVYTGAQIIATNRLDEMPSGPFSLNLYWDELLRRGRLYGALYPGRWCDVGQPEGIALAEAMLEGRT